MCWVGRGICLKRLGKGGDLLVCMGENVSKLTSGTGGGGGEVCTVWGMFGIGLFV